jgi:hypothetical protein
MEKLRIKKQILEANIVQIERKKEQGKNPKLFFSFELTIIFTQKLKPYRNFVLIKTVLIFAIWRV